MSKQKIVSIKQAPEKKTLSKAQKLFNSLISKIDTQKKLLREWQETMPLYEKKVAEEYDVLWDAFNNARVDFAQMLDKAYDHKLFKKRDKEKLTYIIRDIVDQVSESPEQHDRIKDLYNRYHESDFDSDIQEQEALADEMMKSMVKEMFDIDLPEDFDIKNPHHSEAFLKEKFEEKMRAMEEQEQERKSKRKKTAKQLEKEAMQKEHEQHLSKSIQEVYRKLVKTLHPDREQDETERQRKTELMQRVNIAYEKKDLLQLLELQLEIEQIDQDHLNNIAEDRLKYFNKILQEQLDELKQEIGALEDSIKMRLRYAPFQSISPKRLMIEINQSVKELEVNTANLKQDLKVLQDVANLKDFLKGYRIPRETRYEPDLEDLFAEFEMMSFKSGKF